MIFQLNENWEIIRQEVMELHSAMIAYYRQSKKHLQQVSQEGEVICMWMQPRPSLLCAGKKFKKSTEKDKNDMEFVPTNLHIQQMKVTTGESMCISNTNDIFVNKFQYICLKTIIQFCS